MFGVIYDTRDGKILNYTTLPLHDFDKYVRDNVTSTYERAIYIDRSKFLSETDVVSFLMDALSYAITDEGNIVKYIDL